MTALVVPARPAANPAPDEVLPTPQRKGAGQELTTEADAYASPSVQ